MVGVLITVKAITERASFRRGNLFVYLRGMYVEIYQDAEKGHGESEHVCSVSYDEIDSLIASLVAAKTARVRG